MFLHGSRHLFWSHTRDDGARLQEDGHALCGGATAKWVRDLGYERCCIHGDEGVLQSLLDKVAKNVVLKDKIGKFYDKCHLRRAIRAMEPWRKPSAQCVDSTEHIWQFSKTNSRLLK